MDFYLTIFFVHGDVGDRSHVTAEATVLGNASPLALGRGLPPPSLFRNGLKHASSPHIILEKL